MPRSKHYTRKPLMQLLTFMQLNICSPAEPCCCNGCLAGRASCCTPAWDLSPVRQPLRPWGKIPHRVIVPESFRYSLLRPRAQSWASPLWGRNINVGLIYLSKVRGGQAAGIVMLRKHIAQKWLPLPDKPLLCPTVKSLEALNRPPLSHAACRTSAQKTPLSSQLHHSSVHHQSKSSASNYKK